MKVMAINGSPRENGNTAALLGAALDAAASAGAQTELVNLYGLKYSGCLSCFACKRRGGEKCRCFLDDELSPVLELVLASDALLLGSPVYFGDVSGQMRCFLERLGFITLSYERPGGRVFTGSVDCAFFFTMNVAEKYAAMYDAMFKNTLLPLRNLGGSVEKYLCTDTMQFDDYSKYEAAMFNEEAKRARHEEFFPLELAAAAEIGRRLAKA